MHNLHVVMSSFASPMAEYFPQTEIEVGNEMFWYIFDGEAVAERGQLQLDDSGPGIGLTLKTAGLEKFLKSLRSARRTTPMTNSILDSSGSTARPRW